MERLFTTQEVLGAWNKSCKVDNCIVEKEAKDIVREALELKIAEEQGLLFVTPFKIGQPIWFVGNELINDYVIRQFIVTECGVEAVKISKVIDGKEYWNTFYTEQWLVSVFPSKEKAEQKLAEMKGK